MILRGMCTGRALDPLPEPPHERRRQLWGLEGMCFAIVVRGQCQAETCGSAQDGKLANRFERSSNFAQGMLGLRVRRYRSIRSTRVRLQRIGRAQFIVAAAIRL